MTKFIGRLADIGIAKEAVRGTAETAATFYLPKMSMSIDDGIMQVVDESSVGVIEDSTDAQVTGKFATGEFEGKVGDKSLGLLLLGVFGAVSTTGGGETSTYVHSYTVDESAQHDSLTLFQDDPNQDYKYALGMIDSFDLEVALEEYCKVTVGFRAKAGETATLTPSYTAENSFLPQHATLAYAANLAGLSSPTTVNVRNIQLSVAKNVEDDRRLGSTAATDILNKQLSVEGSVELVFDAETFKTQMLADTAQAIRITLENTDVTIGSTLHPKLVITLAKVKWSEFTRNYENDEIVTATASFKAHYSISDSAMITAALTNAQSSY